MGAASSMVTSFVTYAKGGQQSDGGSASDDQARQQQSHEQEQLPVVPVQLPLVPAAPRSVPRDIEHWRCDVLNDSGSATDVTWSSSTGSSTAPAGVGDDSDTGPELVDTVLRLSEHLGDPNSDGPRITVSAVAEACAAAAATERRRRASSASPPSDERRPYERAPTREALLASLDCSGIASPSGRHLRPLSAAYVNYIPEIYAREVGNVRQWLFPSDFCQSRLGDRQIGSNACTLIVVVMAHRIHDQKISIPGQLNHPLSAPLISALAESIVDGNEIHQMLLERDLLNNVNLTLPEALEHYGRAQHQWMPPSSALRTLVEWNTILEPNTLTTDTLFEALHRGIMQWEGSARQLSTAQEPNLYAVLIADVRSMLIFYERNLRKVTLLDTHAHGGNHGAVVAQVEVANLRDLCQWYCDLCRAFSTSHTQFFEISFLYFRQTTLPSRTRSKTREWSAGRMTL